MKNAMQLHLKQDKMRIDEFKTSFDAFAGMIQSLSDSEAPGTRWMLSVDRGSLFVNAELVSDDETVDVVSMFKVIEGHVTALNKGEDCPSCPKKAKREYPKLVSSIEGGGGGRAARGEIVVCGEDGASNALPLVRQPNGSPLHVLDKGYGVIGSVTGVVTRIDVKGRYSFAIANEVDGRQISGKFPDHLLDAMKDALKNRVVVSGRLAYGADGQIKSTDARKVTLLPSAPVRFGALRGVLEA